MTERVGTRRVTFYIPAAMREEIETLIGPMAGTIPGLIRQRLMGYATALNAGSGFPEGAVKVKDLGFAASPRSAVVLRVDEELVGQIEAQVGRHGGTIRGVAKDELCRYLKEERAAA